MSDFKTRFLKALQLTVSKVQRGSSPSADHRHPLKMVHHFGGLVVPLQQTATTNGNTQAKIPRRIAGEISQKEEQRALKKGQDAKEGEILQSLDP